MLFMPEDWAFSVSMPEQETKPDRPYASSKAQEAPTKPQGVCILHENSDSSSDSSEYGHLHTILQLEQTQTNLLSQ